MIPLLISIIIFLAVILIALLIRQQSSGNQTAGLQQALNQLAQQQGQQMQQTVNLVLQQLNQHQESQERTSSVMHTRLDHATRVVADVQTKLSQLEEANKRIFDVGKDISKLQQILQAPKMRGTLGEVWLQELISQMLPSESYQMQYSFRSGEICDAVIFLRDNQFLPVDAKFSLENFTRMLECEDEAEKSNHRKLFGADVKRRIDEIAKKYILPHEGTLEFALMYVPAENVYYQAFIQDDGKLGLLEYAFRKHVVPVSPSSFQAYLQLILMGLRGMEIEKSAREIQKNLSGLQVDFGRFGETYQKVGSHLRNAQNSYEQADKRLDKITHKLETLSSSEHQILETNTPLLHDE